MVFRLVKVFILIIVSLTSSTVFSEKRVGAKGHLDCGRFLSGCDESKLNINCQTQTFYVQGYLSGVSWEQSIRLEAYEQDSIKYALIKYCRENPLKDTHDGAVSILQQLK